MIRNLILVGFPGTGKTQAGRLAANALGWEFVDSDEVITSRTARTIEDIFSRDGEPAFRAMEQEALRWLCSGEQRVIGTGGGSFINPENREMMLQAGLVVCLEAPPDIIWQRLSSSRDADVRPLLKGEDPLQRIRELKSSRQSCYNMAHHSLHTDGLSLEQVADALVAAVQACADVPHARADSAQRADSAKEDSASR